MQYFGLKFFHFLSYVKETNQEQKKYLHYCSDSNEYKIVATKAFTEIGKSFERITFGTFLKLAYGYLKNKKIKYDEAKIILNAFHSMHTDKIDNQRKQIFALNYFNHYVECFQNKIDGFGLVSTNQIYNKLVSELEKIPPSEKVDEIENNLRKKSEQASPKVSIDPKVIIIDKKNDSSSSQSKNKPPLSRSRSEISRPLEKPVVQSTNICSKSIFTSSDSINVPSEPTNTSNSRRTQLKRVRSANLAKLGEAFLTNAAATANTTVNFKAQTKILNIRDHQEQYFNNCENCPDEVRNMVLQNITAAIPHHEPNPECDDPHYLVDVLAKQCKSKDIDLENPQCKKTILDMFWCKELKEQDLLLEWLIPLPTRSKNQSVKQTQKTNKKVEAEVKKANLSLSFLGDIFKKLEEKSNDQQKVIFPIVTKLFAYYLANVEEKIYIDNDPAKNEGIVAAIALMLYLQPNENKTIEYVTWFCNNSTFKLEIFIKFIHSFIRKNRLPSEDFLARNVIIDKFLENPDNWQNLKSLSITKNCLPNMTNQELDDYVPRLMTYLEEIFIDFCKSRDPTTCKHLFNWIKNPSAFSLLFLNKCFFKLFDRMVLLGNINLDPILEVFPTKGTVNSENFEEILYKSFWKLDSSSRDDLLIWMQRETTLTLSFWKRLLKKLTNKIDDQKEIDASLLKSIFTFCRVKFYQRERNLAEEDYTLAKKIEQFFKNHSQISLDKDELWWLGRIQIQN